MAATPVKLLAQNEGGMPGPRNIWFTVDEAVVELGQEMSQRRVATGPQFLWMNIINVMVLGGASGNIILPVYLEQSGLTRWEIGLAWAAFSVAAITLRLRLGGWLQRIGQLWFLRAGALILAFCQLCYSAMIPSTPIVTALRLLEGAALACYFTAIWSRIIDTAPPTAVSRFSGLFGISGLLAGATGPWILEQVVRAHGFPRTFVCSGALALSGGLLTFTLREIPKALKAPTADSSFLSVARQRAMFAVVLSSLLFGLTLGSFNTFIAPFAQSLKLEGVGKMFLCYTLASISVRISFGGSSDRIRPDLIIVPAMALFGTAMGLLSWTAFHPSLGLVIASGVLIGSAHGLVYPAISTLALHRSGTSSNTASSVFTACMDLGALVGASLSGLVSHHLGYSVTWGVLGVILWMGATRLLYEAVRIPARS